MNLTAIAGIVWHCFHGNGGVFLSLQVEITLQDVNDNPPVFPNDLLDVTSEENISDGFKIMQLTATDADEVKPFQKRYTYIFCLFLV